MRYANCRRATHFGSGPRSSAADSASIARAAGFGCDYLDTLTADEWEQPSLCPGWSVRDVVGHIASYDVLSWPALLALFARSGFSLTRCNQVGVDEARRLRTDELVARLSAHALPRGITTAFGCAVALTDGLTLAGRPQALADLEGPGLDTLAARLRS